MNCSPSSLSSFLSSETKHQHVKHKIGIMLFMTSNESKQLQHTLASINQQTSPHWELYVITHSQTFMTINQLHATLHASTIKNPTLIISTLPPHKIAYQAQESYLTFLSTGDTLNPDFVYVCLQQQAKTPSVRLLYTDHTLLSDTTKQPTPHFKPDWNPDYLNAYNYISYATVFYKHHLMTLKYSVLKQPFDYFHHLILNLTQHYNDDEIKHLSNLMFCFDVTPKKTTTALADYFILEEGVFSPLALSLLQKKEREQRLINNTPLVSIIIPTKNQYTLLKQCIDSLLHNTSYPSIELLIIDNQSDDPETKSYLKQLSHRQDTQVLNYPHPFNYSAINNFAVKKANGSFIALLNNDIKVINADWLSEMVVHACRPEIGCVGAKLYYPDGTIQHGGVILGIKGTASHAHKYFPKEHLGYFNRLVVTQNVSAVTAACLVMRKTLFEQVGGFDDVNLKVAYNDVDLCLKVLSDGYRNLWTPYAELIHYESKSRGKKRSWWQRRKLRKEARFLQKKWGKLLLNDPYYNPNLTLETEDFSLKNKDE